MSIFSKTLRALREKNSMTQEELAKELSVSVVHVERLESDYTQPDEEMIQRISKVFFVDTSYLRGNPLREIEVAEPGVEHSGNRYMSVPVVNMKNATKLIVRENDIIDHIILPCPRDKDIDYIGVFIDNDDVDCPRVVRGDIAIVMITTRLSNNDLVAVSFMDRPMLFRRYTRVGPTIVLRSDKGNEPITYDIGDKYYRIVGKVIGFQGTL